MHKSEDQFNTDYVANNSVRKTIGYAGRQTLNVSPNRMTDRDTVPNSIFSNPKVSASIPRGKDNTPTIVSTATGDTLQEAYNKASDERTNKLASGALHQERKEQDERSEKWDRSQEARGNMPKRGVVKIRSDK